MSMKPETAARIAKIKKALFKAAVVVAAVLNAFVVLPGIVMGVVTGHYVPSIVLVLLSVAAWTAGLAVVKAVRSHRARLAEETAAD